MARHADDYRFGSTASREDDRRPYDDSREEERRCGGYESDRGDIRHYAPAGRRRSEHGHGGDRYTARGGGFRGRPGGAGRYGSEHAGMGGGFGIGASGQYHHRGKGPRGYTRSDDRIREDVCDCLTDDPMLDAGEIEVQVKNGEVTRSGTVSDRLAKSHAEDMIGRASGVKDVQNALRVKERDTARSSGGKASLS